MSAKAPTASTPASRSVSSRRPGSPRKTGTRKRAASVKVASSKGTGVWAEKAGFLLKFRAADSSYGVTRGTVKAISNALGLTETQVVHIALSKLAQEVLPAYEPDDGPLTQQQLAALRRDAKERLAKGEILSRQSLFG
jgi:hypothetical protein